MLCWNCGLKTMQPWEDLGKGWFKCSDCGATWVKPLKLGMSPISIVRDDTCGLTKYKPRSVHKARKAKK